MNNKTDYGDMMASPTPAESVSKGIGLTKREWIATMCLQGLLATPETPDAIGGDELVPAAINFADELLKALNK